MCAYSINLVLQTYSIGYSGEIREVREVLYTLYDGVCRINLVSRHADIRTRGAS